MKLNRINHEFVKLIPENIQDGKLYISLEYKCVVHNCCCGCKSEVVTPIDNNGWSFKEESGKITLNPSIGNFQLPCKSHYFINNNNVIWA